jgi:serine/threonine protein kinase
MDSPEASAMNAHTGSHLEPATVGSPMHPAIGESIQRFEIIGLARDQGAESDLYLVRSPDGPKCMLKLYRSGMQPATVVKEMHLHHRRIASPLLTGTWNGRPYEIAPFFERGSLAHLIQRDGPLKLSSAELILRQLVEGLAALHRAGIQHRDLKPSNILIESETPLEVVLTDFGSSALATMTLLTEVRTTLAYAAPETLTGMYSRASDYWSLGIVLIEILTGQNPLQWFGSSKIASYQIVQGKVPIPDTLPAHWQRLLKGLLERDHYKRWDDARILRWLVENRNSGEAKQVNWFRRVILLGSAILLIGFASVIGMEIQKSMLGGHESPTLSLNSAKSIQHSSVDAERRLADQSFDLKANPWLRIGLLTFAWVIAVGLVLAGFGHCISGTPHGVGLICGGIALAVAALYLPQLLR